MYGWIEATLYVYKSIPDFYFIIGFVLGSIVEIGIMIITTVFTYTYFKTEHKKGREVN